MEHSQRNSWTFTEETRTFTEELRNHHRGTLESLQRNSGTLTEELLNLHRGALEPSQRNWATRLESNWAPGCRAAWEPDSQSSPRVESAFKWIMWRCKTYSWTPTPAKTLNVPTNIFRTIKENKRIPPNKIIIRFGSDIVLLCTDVTLIWGPALLLICFLMSPDPF